MQDSRARARFPRPEVRTAAGWGRSARSLAADPGFIRLSRTLWAALPPGTGAGELMRRGRAAPSAVLAADVTAPEVLHVWERAALLQTHRIQEDLLVSHLSAARMWGLPLSPSPMPWSHRLLGEPPAFRALETRPQLSYLGRPRHPENGSLILHRSLGLPSATGPWDSQVTGSIETLLACMPWLPGWRAVAAVDRALMTGPQLAGPMTGLTADDLLSVAAALPPGTRGIARLRRAVERSAPQTWSPMETLLRLVVMRAGLPAPVMNLPVHLPDGTRFVLDLAWHKPRTALEYNGRVHYEDRRTYGDEQHRSHVLEDLGWKVRTVVVADLKDPQRLSALLRWLRRSLA